MTDAGTPLPRGGVWRNPAFRRIWIAQVVSEVGDWGARLVMSVLVLAETGSALMTALVFSISLLPALGPGQWLTVRTGRLPRRTLFLITETTRAALLLLLGLFPSTALALVVAFVTGLVRVPFISQRSAMVPEIVGLDLVVSATKVYQVTQNLTIPVGYATAGVLLGVTEEASREFGAEESAVLFIAAAAFAISGALLASIRHPANRLPATDETAPSLGSGWRALRNLPAVTAAAALSAVALGAGVAIEAQATPLACRAGDRERCNPDALPSLLVAGTEITGGTLAAALLVGSALAAALAAAAVPSRWREKALLTWAAALIMGPAAVAIIGFSSAGVWPWAPAVAFVACGVMFGAAGPANSVASLQLPVGQRAAVFALVTGVLFASQAVAALIGGYLFDQFGTDGLAALLVVPIVAAAAIHLAFTRRLADPLPRPGSGSGDGGRAGEGQA